MRRSIERHGCGRVALRVGERGGVIQSQLACKQCRRAEAKGMAKLRGRKLSSPNQDDAGEHKLYQVRALLGVTKRVPHLHVS